MTTYTAEEGKALIIGRQGEYNATEIVFDLSELEETVGSGTAVLIHYPFAGEPYIVPTEAGETYDAAVLDDTTLTWTVGQLATMYPGDGYIAASWVAESGLKKSKRFRTKCYESIGDATEITDAQQSYIDQMTELTSTLLDELQDAENSLDAISEAVTSGTTSINAAADEAIERVETAVSNAEDTITDLQSATSAADNKIAEIENAEESAMAAVQAAANVTVENECLVYGGGANG